MIGQVTAVIRPRMTMSPYKSNFGDAFYRKTRRASTHGEK